MSEMTSSYAEQKKLDPIFRIFFFYYKLKTICYFGKSTSSVSSPSEQCNPQVILKHRVEHDALKASLQLLAVPQSQSSQHRHTLVMIPATQLELRNEKFSF